MIPSLMRRLCEKICNKPCTLKHCGVAAQINVEHLLSAAHVGPPMQDINLLGSYLEGLSMGAPGPSEQVINIHLLPLLPSQLPHPKEERKVAINLHLPKADWIGQAGCRKFHLRGKTSTTTCAMLTTICICDVMNFCSFLKQARLHLCC